MSAVDLRDGSLRWQVPGFAMMPIGTPVLGDDLLFAVSFHPIGKSEDRITLTWAELLAKYDARWRQEVERHENFPRNWPWSAAETRTGRGT